MFVHMLKPASCRRTFRATKTGLSGLLLTAGHREDRPAGCRQLDQCLSAAEYRGNGVFQPAVVDLPSFLSLLHTRHCLCSPCLLCSGTNRTQTPAQSRLHAVCAIRITCFVLLLPMMPFVSWSHATTHQHHRRLAMATCGADTQQ